MPWEIQQGDSIELLRKMEPNSVDSIVRDPPAGIGFMHDAASGRTWDRKHGYEAVTDRGREVSSRFVASSLPKRFRVKLRAQIEATILTACANGEAEHEQDLLAQVGGIEGARRMALAAVAEQGLLAPWEVGFLVFMVDVAVEELRVIKPGGHSLSWALPRTCDLTMMALRLAGWDVRDSILNLFGSGFPKSANISKLLDKAADAEREDIGPTDRHVSGKPEQRTAGLVGSGAFAETVGMGARLVGGSCGRQLT